MFAATPCCCHYYMAPCYFVLRYFDCYALMILISLTPDYAATPLLPRVFFFSLYTSRLMLLLILLSLLDADVYALRVLSLDIITMLMLLPFATNDCRLMLTCHYCHRHHRHH